jgi:hypothetical protein
LSIEIAEEPGTWLKHTLLPVKLPPITAVVTPMNPPHVFVGRDSRAASVGLPEIKPAALKCTIILVLRQQNLTEF